MPRPRPGRLTRHLAVRVHRVACRAEPGLGHADDRDTEHHLRLRAQAEAAAGIKINVAIDDQQAETSRWPSVISTQPG